MDPHTLSLPKNPSPASPPPSASSTNATAIERHEMASPREAGIGRVEADGVLQELHRRAEEDDSENFCHYELDAEGRLKRLFWADVDSRLEFILECRDVVVFDTTYRTNKYGVPFVPFMGLNRHRRPVLLGCGVISDQSLDSYLWLLRAFMMCCGGGVQEERPTSVITDGGDAVVAAVKTVLPDANHRICSWHLEQGVEEHLHGSPARNEFRSMIYDACSSPAAFEERWHRFLAIHRTAASQRWLDAMYGKRELWAAAFVHVKFFLGMASDQRTECLATALHTGLHEGMSLPDLLRHADACARALRRDAFRLDVEAESCRLELTTKHRDMEEHAARRFTPANFYLLREEINMIDGFEVVRTTLAGDHGKLYVVGFKQRPGVLFHVERSGSGGAVKCSCRKMEREGLPCRHIFCVMHHDRTPLIPDCCGLRRLRRRGDTKADRIDEMEELGRQVFDLASEDAKEFKEIKEFFEGWLEDRRRGSGAVAVEDRDDAANAETGSGNTPMTKKIKLLDD